MNLSCGNLELLNNVDVACAQPAGLGETIYAFNYKDIVPGFDDDGNVTAITLRPCAKGYVIEGKFGANSFTGEMSLVTGSPVFAPNPVLRGAYSTPAQRNRLNKLAKASRLVLIFENNGNMADRYRIAGITNGVRATSFVDNIPMEAAELTGFEMTFTGVETDMLAYLLPTGADTYVEQTDYIKARTSLASPAAVTEVLTGDNGFNFTTGDTITIKGCGFTGVTNVAIGGRSTNPSTGTSYNSDMTVVDDNTITILIGSKTGTTDVTNSTAVTLTRAIGNLTFTNPISIQIQCVGDA